MAKARKYNDGIINFIRQFKDVPCMDCGINYPYYVMDFDHRENKEFSLAFGQYKSKQKIIEEIGKCDVVCSNCHRERTHKRRINGNKT